MANARPLDDAALARLREDLAGGKRPSLVLLRGGAGLAAGSRGQLVRIDDPPQDAEFLHVKVGNDELPFAPEELGLPGRRTRGSEAPAGGSAGTAGSAGNGSPAGSQRNGRAAASRRASSEPRRAAAPSRASAEPREPAASHEAGSSRGPEPSRDAGSSHGPEPSRDAGSSRGPEPSREPEPILEPVRPDRRTRAERVVEPPATPAEPRVPEPDPAVAERPGENTTTSKARARRATRPGGPGKITLTLRFADFGWTVEPLVGGRRDKPQPVPLAAIRAFADQLEDQALRRQLDTAVEACREEARKKATALREELARLETELAALDD